MTRVVRIILIMRIRIVDLLIHLVNVLGGISWDKLLLSCLLNLFRNKLLMIVVWLILCNVIMNILRKVKIWLWNVLKER